MESDLPHRAAQPQIERLPRIVIDADAATGIPTFDLRTSDGAERANLLHQGPGFPYTLRPGAKTLVIGPGGGWDVARALTGGSQDITAVEINPIIAHTIMQQRFCGPEPSTVFPSRSASVCGRRPQLCAPQSGEVSGAAGHAGGYLGVHGRRSFRAFGKQSLHHRRVPRLSESLNGRRIDGLHTLGFRSAARSLRLLSLAIEALGEVGETDAWRHVVVLRDHAQNINGFGALDTVMIFRKPLADADIARGEVGIEPDQAAGLYIPAMRRPTSLASCCGAPIRKRSGKIIAITLRRWTTTGRSSFTPCSRAISGFSETGRPVGGLQDQSRAAVIV